MADRGARAVAFDSPGVEPRAAAQARPIDLAHLARQTLGDREVEREVLALFVQQALSVRERLGQAGPAERFSLAHGLKGSARGVGAFAIAECMAAIERQPDDHLALKGFPALVDELCEFVASISR